VVWAGVKELLIHPFRYPRKAKEGMFAVIIFYGYRNTPVQTQSIKLNNDKQ